MKDPQGRQSGAALIAAIVMLLIIDCIVLGTVHLALIESRVAGNALLVLRLRLAAESAVRAQALAWTAQLDSMQVAGPALQQPAMDSDGFSLHVVVERLAPALFLVRGESRVGGTRPGGHAAAMLVVPALMPAADEPAAAALSAHTVRVLPGGGVDASFTDCAPDSAAAVVLADSALLLEDFGVVVGRVLAGGADGSVVADFDRIAGVAAAAARTEVPGLRWHPGDLTLDEDFHGVLVATGSVTIAAAVRGLVLVGGRVDIESGALIEGAVHVAGHAAVSGRIVLDGCAVHDALAASGLQRPRALPGRAAVPQF